MKSFRPYLHDLATEGTVTWQLGNGRKNSICFLILRSGDRPKIVLMYEFPSENDKVTMSVQTQSTGTQFGGRRWWFTCPLIVNDVPCERRVDKLYLPPGSRYFGCRHCHDLTYRSCQESHYEERMYGRMRRFLEMSESLK